MHAVCVVSGVQAAGAAGEAHLLVLADLTLPERICTVVGVAPLLEALSVHVLAAAGAHAWANQGVGWVLTGGGVCLKTDAARSQHRRAVAAA
jgi:hypothetical protein